MNFAKKNKWSTIGFLFLTVWVPIFLLYPHIGTIVEVISANANTILSVTANLLTFTIGIYLILRFFVAFTTNKFMPAIPLPTNKILKYVVLTSIGVFVAVFSSTITLIIWVAAILIGINTFGLGQQERTMS